MKQIEIDKGTRKKSYVKMLKSGKTPRTVIEFAVDEYHIAEATAYNEVYEVNAMLNKSLKEISDNAAEYIVNVLIGEIEELEDDHRSKLKAVELLGKVTKAFDDKPNVTIVNGGFKFGE